MKKKIKLTQVFSKPFLYLFLVAGAVSCLFPLYWQIRSSLMTNAEIFINPPVLFPSELEWENYSEALLSFDALQYFINTLIVVVPSFFGTVITSIMAAYGFARFRFPGRRVWFALAVASMFLPSVVTMIPTYIMWSKLGLIDTYVPLILPAWFGGGAFNIFLLRQFFRGIPMSIDEAARIDGAGPLRILLQVLLPQMRPAVITVSLFTFMGAWNDYFGPLLYLNDESKFTLALGLTQFKGAYASQWNYLFAMSTLMILPVIILFCIGQKYFIEGVALTGTKG